LNANRATSASTPSTLKHSHRRWRALGYLADFPRVNRRMHNKSLTADNRAGYGVALTLVHRTAGSERCSQSNSGSDFE